jgi:hypothetical protein
MSRTLLLPLLSLLLAACADGTPPFGEGNAVYFWRTSLTLDSTERSFLQQHHIGRFYCRYFDVVMGVDGEPVPNATLRIDGTADLPAVVVSIIPTVYITEDCMHQPHDSLAVRLVRRIAQMNETHGIEHVRELQMDCDYTARSRQIYFDFLNQLRTEARQHGMRLSVTIRLHQLSMAVPPADYGVLMLYNTGDPRRFYERNPILDRRDVQPYLQHLPDYNLTLAAAYPIFRWQRDIQGVRVEHVAEAGEILQVKQAVERKRADLSQHIITYHLDKENIRRYGNETFEAIYHH